MKAYYAEHIEMLRSQPTSAIHLNDPITVGIQVILRNTLIDLFEQEAACHDDRVTEAMRLLHKAAEKLQTTLALATPYMEPKQAKRFTKRLNKLSSKVNGVRELDIIMHSLLIEGEGAADRRAIAGILAHMDAKRLLAKEGLYAFLESKKYRQFVSQLASVAQVDEDTPLFRATVATEEPHQVRHVLPMILHEHLAMVRAYTPSLDDAKPETLSDLRQKVRRLYDICEAFHGVLDDELAQYLQALDDVLVSLDQIAEMTGTLDRLIHLPRTTLNTDQFTVLKDFRESFRERREQLVKKFPEQWFTFDQRTTHEALSKALCAVY